MNVFFLKKSDIHVVTYIEFEQVLLTIYQILC